jgi:hypothetical protein
MIPQELIDKVATIIDRAGLSPESVAALRDALPDLHFTYCSDDDIGDGIPPIREADGFNLYLINGAEHCIRFTNDPESATGMVLAEVTEEDD